MKSVCPKQYHRILLYIVSIVVYASQGQAKIDSILQGDVSSRTVHTLNQHNFDDLVFDSKVHGGSAKNSNFNSSSSTAWLIMFSYEDVDFGSKELEARKLFINSVQTLPLNITIAMVIFDNEQNVALSKRFGADLSLVILVVGRQVYEFHGNISAQSLQDFVHFKFTPDNSAVHVPPYELLSTGSMLTNMYLKFRRIFYFVLQNREALLILLLFIGFYTILSLTGIIYLYRKMFREEQTQTQKMNKKMDKLSQKKKQQ